MACGSGVARAVPVFWGLIREQARSYRGWSTCTGSFGDFHAVNPIHALLRLGLLVSCVSLGVASRWKITHMPTVRLGDIELTTSRMAMARHCFYFGGQ